MNLTTLLTVLFFLGATCSAYCCSFESKTDEQNFADARTVFHARIVETKVSTVANPGNPQETVEIVEGKYELIESFKGNAPRTGIVRDLRFLPGNCSLGLIAGWEYVFYPNDHDLVLLPTGSFGFFNRDGTEVKPKLEKLRALKGAR